jgi:hypothetical protein
MIYVREKNQGFFSPCPSRDFDGVKGSSGNPNLEITPASEMESAGGSGDSVFRFGVPRPVHSPASRIPPGRLREYTPLNTRAAAHTRREGIHTQPISFTITSFPRELRKDVRPMGEILMGAQGKE